MRKRAYFVALGATAGIAAMLPLGCSHYYEDYYLTLTDPKLATTGSGGHDAGTGGTGGNKPDCTGDPSAKNVSDDCGVFVRADSATGVEDGTMANPYKSLQLAVNATGGKRVYVCASAPFSEAVTVNAAVEVYGGFDCTKGWSWSKDARAHLDGPADSIALTISGDGARVEGFAITAASPSNPKGGGSSIAVAVGDVAATLVRCDVKAGDAADGVKGTTPSGAATSGANAAAPDSGTMNACINPASENGGVPGVTMCGNVDTSGGKGGKGGITGMPDGTGQKGADGSPTDMTSGLGGAGEAASKCGNGGVGGDGTVGPAGLGGSMAGDKLSLAGVTNGDASDGQTGTPGHGGGGGGGAKSGVFCPPAGMLVDGPGASGGGGGAGGCGGKGGGGGKAGGSSIAIVSLGTKLTMTEVTLATGKAGKGGDGATGQGGGAYGNGANGGAASGQAGSKPGCKGGDGGAGGDGGPGGGGRGGHSIGIAYAKAPAAMPMVKTFTPGTPGNGGMPGAAMGNVGAIGADGQCWDFGTNAGCN